MAPIAMPALAPPLRPEEEDFAVGDGSVGFVVTGPAVTAEAPEEEEDVELVVPVADSP